MKNAYDNKRRERAGRQAGIRVQNKQTISYKTDNMYKHNMYIVLVNIILKTDEEDVKKNKTYSYIMWKNNTRTVYFNKICITYKYISIKYKKNYYYFSDLLTFAFHSLMYDTVQ